MNRIVTVRITLALLAGVSQINLVAMVEKNADSKAAEGAKGVEAPAENEESQTLLSAPRS